jgi:hypothetical protein
MAKKHILWLIALTGLQTTAFTTACRTGTKVEDIPLGEEVTVTIEDGTVIRGHLLDVGPETLVLESPSTGRHTAIQRTAVAEVKPNEEAKRSLLGDLWPDEPEFKEVTIAAGTILPIKLDGGLASNVSTVEDTVRGTLRSRVIARGLEAIPAGSPLTGIVTEAMPSGAVKGRARLAFEFRHVKVGQEIYDISTKPLEYEAKGTKQQDAAKIGAGAAAGSVIGSIAGGKKGAAVGAVIGGSAGTAMVLTTSGDEVQLASGTDLSVELAKPVTVRVPKAATSALELGS